MNNPCKISVIVPVYGVAQFIARCANSLFGQTFKNGIEFIFVNDCTKDNSIEILKGVLEEYPNRKCQVTIINHEKNKGLPQARKTGVLAARGEFIAHCDSDDWVDVTIYQKMYETAISENADIVCCDYYTSDGNKKNAVNYTRLNKLLTGPVWNKIVRRSLYTEHRIEYPIANKAEDGALMAQLSFYAEKITKVPESLYYYFQNPESICRVMSEDAVLKRYREEIINTELRISFLRERNALKKYSLDIINWKKECRSNLTPYISKMKYKKMWRKTYPELNYQYLFCRGIGIKQKICFVANYLGLNFLLSEFRTKIHRK